MQLPVITFIQARLSEVDPAFEVREGTAHYDLFVIPQQFMLQPLNNFIAQRLVAQSVKLMLEDPTPDTPTTFASSDVDNAASNVYVSRNQGNISTTTVRVSYITAKALEFPALTAQFTAGSLNFFNSTNYTLSQSQMALQSNGSLFFADIPVQAELAGDQYNVLPGAITAFLNDTDAVIVTNLSKAVGGLPTETNTQLLDRIPNSIAVRDLETGKGIDAILGSNFQFLSEIISIGMGDPEMQRDIIYNVHIGSHTDVYLKTPSLTTGTAIFNDLVPDTTRSISNNLHIELATFNGDPVNQFDMGTPSIVVGSVVITEDIVDTAASATGVTVSPTAGIDLSENQYLNMQLDKNTAIQFKASGADPAATQLFEIINAINTALGETIATSVNNKLSLTSETLGNGSQIIFNAIAAPATGLGNAYSTLFNVSSPTYPVTYSGIGAAVYVEGIDYEVDYVDGYIYQTSFTPETRDPASSGRQTITSGQTMIDAAATGSITFVSGKYRLTDSVTNQFNNKPIKYVRAGDEVTITAASPGIGISLPATFVVAKVIDGQNLLLSNFRPTGVSASITYSIVSSQTVDITYQYNPISIDIGGLTLLASGSRGIRPGRDAFTITAGPFVSVVSIEEVDPATGEVIGDPLLPPQGFGQGGYGDGPYGVGNSGDYRFIVNDATVRYSMFEDSMIVFNDNALGLSYQVTYQYVPELQAVHTFCRSDTERVTGADVLPKSVIPGFVDMAINVLQDPTNATPPTDAVSSAAVANLVNTTLIPTGITETAIIVLLEGMGIEDVQTPFTMKATVQNPDGSTSIYTSQDTLAIPPIVLPSQTSNFSTSRIVGWFPGNITVTTVAPTNTTS